MACHLCAHPDAPHPLSIGKDFTARDQCLRPDSKMMCDRCFDLIAGRYQYAWYWNEGKQKWSRIFTRNPKYWLLRDPRDLESPRNRPYFGALRDEGKGEWHELCAMPSYGDAREWLLNPPEPPFCLAIGISGQKHVLPFAQEARSRDYFPVQVETEAVWIDRDEIARLIEKLELLLAAGFSKKEISAWERQPYPRSAKANLLWISYDSEMRAFKASGLFDLACLVSVRPELLEPKSDPEPEPQSLQPSQLSLF